MMTMEKDTNEPRQLYQSVACLKAELDSWQDRLIDRFTASMAEFDGIMECCDSVLYQAARICGRSPGAGEGQDERIPPDRV